MKKISLFFVVFGLLLFSYPADAYLDPGSGSIVLQVLLGGVAGAALVIKLFWHRILEILHIRKKNQDGNTKG